MKFRQMKFYYTFKCIVFGRWMNAACPLYPRQQREQRNSRWIFLLNDDMRFLYLHFRYVTNKLKEFIIHALLFTRIEHVSISH